MPVKGTLTKAHIVDAVIEANGFTRRKSVETVETLLEEDIEQAKIFLKKMNFDNRFEIRIVK